MSLSRPFPMAMGRRSHFKTQGRCLPLTDLDWHCSLRYEWPGGLGSIGGGSRPPQSRICLSVGREDSTGTSLCGTSVSLPSFLPEHPTEARPCPSRGTAVSRAGHGPHSG